MGKNDKNDKNKASTSYNPFKGHKHGMEEIEKLINKPLETTIRPRDYFLNEAQRSSEKIEEYDKMINDNPDISREKIYIK